jgi:hypothetical protein
MTVEYELISIDSALAELEFGIADDGVVGSFRNSRDEATLKRLRIEAQTILDNALGIANNFSLNLHFSPIGASPLAEVQECRALIQGAVNHLRRGEAVAPQPYSPSKTQFVDLSRLAALRAAKSPRWDLTRLIRLCEELNTAYSNDCFMSVAMLVRAILDHVPPILDKQTFADVANNYAGPSSFKKSMQNLQLSLRNIADAHLHVPVRQKEVLPTGQQVDFHKDLDVLLGEIVRTLK